MAAGAAAITTAAAPAANTGVMYFSPTRMVLLLMMVQSGLIPELRFREPTSSPLTPIHAPPPTGILALPVSSQRRCRGFPDIRSTMIRGPRGFYGQCAAV